MTDDVFGNALGGLEEITEDPIATAAAGEEELATFEVIEVFWEMAQEVAQADGAHITHQRMYEGLADINLQLQEDGLGSRVADSIRALYQLSDGLEFRWEWEDTRAFGGEIALVGFGRAFGLWIDELWYTGDEASWSLRGFDMPTGEGCVQAVLRFPDPDDLGVYSLCAYDAGRRAVWPLNLSLLDYVYCAIEAKGAPGWQLLFGQQPYDFGQNPWGVPDPRGWLGRMKRVFTQMDDAFFAQRVVLGAPEDLDDPPPESSEASQE